MRTKLERRLTLAVASAAMLAGFGTAPAQAQKVTDFAPIPPVCASEADVPSGCRFQKTVDDGAKTVVYTGSAEAVGLFEQSFPFGEDSTGPSNLLETVFEDVKTSDGTPIPNTLPSTPEDPFNLHPDPTVEPIDNDNAPSDDLETIIKRLKEAVSRREQFNTRRTRFPGGVGVPADPRRGEAEKVGPGSGLVPRPARRLDAEEIQFALDILEGNPVDRPYSGIGLLNFRGVERLKEVDPDTKTVDVKMVWARQNIYSDTMFIDPSNVLDEPWKVRYEIIVTRRGHEDFAPFVMTFDDPALRNGMAVPNVAFDATFFPMEDSNRYILELDMPPGKFYNLTYHWGWRIHPPRIQAIENARKRAAGRPLQAWEAEVFCMEKEQVLDADGNIIDTKCIVGPDDSEEAKLYAIDQIGDLAPAKRMWNGFRALQKIAERPGRRRGIARRIVAEIEDAFMDWNNRNKMPSGIKADPDANVTNLFVNNTMYGEIPEIKRFAEQRTDEWQTRGQTVNVKLLNGDYFPHMYINIDFGGLRGWENTFHNTLPLFAQGPWFTFGRVNWLPNLVNPVMVPAAEKPANPGRVGRGKGRDYAKLPDVARAATSVAKARAMDRAYGKPGVIAQELIFSGDRYADKHGQKGLGEHEVEINFRFDPAQRLRFYQFDPFHHDVAIWSVH